MKMTKLIPPLVSKKTILLSGALGLLLAFAAVQTIRLNHAQATAVQAEKNRQKAQEQTQIMQRQLASERERLSGLLAEFEVVMMQLRALDDENSDIKKELQRVYEHDESAKNWGHVPVPAAISGVLNQS